MKVIVQALTTLNSILGKWFYFLASASSFIGIYILFIKDGEAVTIALYFFCAMLLIFTGTLVYVLLKMLEVRNKDYESRSSFIKYETRDGNNIVYENYKLIQCKKTILTEFEYGFKWTGTHLPIIKSDLQNVINVVDVNDPSNYDKAILRFKKPLYYNKNQIIHFRAELDDTDRHSSPHVECRVTDELDIIHFRIVLKHAPNTYTSNATLQRKKMNSSVNTNFEDIKQIAFDVDTKSYEYHLITPIVGYYYRILWKSVT
jgi:hypothetical protein